MTWEVPPFNLDEFIGCKVALKRDLSIKGELVGYGPCMVEIDFNEYTESHWISDVVIYKNGREFAYD